MASKRREVRSKKDSTTSQMDSTITSLALCWLEAHAAHPLMPRRAWHSPRNANGESRTLAP